MGLQDIYTIYLWNYCAWNGDDSYAYCSPRQAEFYFDPIQVWGLNRTGIDVETLLPNDLKDGLHDYQVASKFMFIFYVVAVVATGLTLLVGTSAIFSRWGSFFTTIFANAAAVFIIIASVIATVLFSILTEVLNNALKDYDIHTSLGQPLLRTTWLGVVFGLGAGFFWLLSVCCCSGRSPYNKDRRGESRRIRVEKTPYTYERVGSPYLGPKDSQAVPLHHLNPVPQGSRNTAYEPYRWSAV